MHSRIDLQNVPVNSCSGFHYSGAEINNHHCVRETIAACVCIMSPHGPEAVLVFLRDKNRKWIPGAVACIWGGKTQPQICDVVMMCVLHWPGEVVCLFLPLQEMVQEQYVCREKMKIGWLSSSFGYFCGMRHTGWPCERQNGDGFCQACTVLQ